MTRCRKLFTTAAAVLMSLCLAFETGIAAQASEGASVDKTCGGVAAVFNPGSGNSVDVVNATAKELNLDLTAEEEEPRESNLVMANVQNALNVRSEASEESDKVGMLYKDCGGTVLERRDGWTKLQSGNIIGWASDEFLIFGDEALALANSVGKMVATVDTETLRVRMEPNTEAGIWGLLPGGEVVEVLNQYDDGWVCIDFEGEDGYVSTEFLVIDFVIDAGETMEEIDARIAAEKEASRHKNFGEYTTDADTTLLLAALIYCEAGSESYEGKLAVGAVVMNRVRSGASPQFHSRRDICFRPVHAGHERQAQQRVRVGRLQRRVRPGGPGGPGRRVQCRRPDPLPPQQRTGGPGDRKPRILLMAAEGK